MSPIPIVTVFDFLWWINFTLKWQHVSLRIMQRLDRIDPTIFGRIFHFYRNYDFQQWSYHHHAEKFPDKNNWKSYKWPLKLFIFENNQDNNYLQNKIKEVSSTHPFGFNLGIDDNFNVIKFGLYCCSQTHFRAKYGNKLEKLLQMPATVQFKNENKTKTKKIQEYGDYHDVNIIILADYYTSQNEYSQNDFESNSFHNDGGDDWGVGFYGGAEGWADG